MALRGCVDWRGGHGLRATLDAVPEIPAAGDESELGALLALLSGAAESFRTVHAGVKVSDVRTVLKSTSARSVAPPDALGSPSGAAGSAVARRRTAGWARMGRRTH
jgi:hypothetical protein